ncbi:unnamed protein product [Amoebophrya sp. A120]|nr:unnamed protein product [Amoebophrya sp. A120]|eukprot:GSA120T00001190001.1
MSCSLRSSPRLLHAIALFLQLNFSTVAGTGFFLKRTRKNHSRAENGQKVTAFSSRTARPEPPPLRHDADVVFTNSLTDEVLATLPVEIPRDFSHFMQGLMFRHELRSAEGAAVEEEKQLDSSSSTSETADFSQITNPRPGKDAGMIFQWEHDDNNNHGARGFWMKQTFIDLDILWCDSKNDLVDFKQAKADDLNAVTPSRSAKFVVEARKGWAAEKLFGRMLRSGGGEDDSRNDNPSFDNIKCAIDFKNGETSLLGGMMRPLGGNVEHDDHDAKEAGEKPQQFFIAKDDLPAFGASREDVVLARARGVLDF